MRHRRRPGPHVRLQVQQLAELPGDQQGPREEQLGEKCVPFCGLYYKTCDVVITTIASKMAVLLAITMQIVISIWFSSFLVFETFCYKG